MSKLTTDRLLDGWYVLYDLMKQDDLRMWERQVLRDARTILTDLLRKNKEKAVTSSQAAAPDLNTDTPRLAKE